MKTFQMSKILKILFQNIRKLFLIAFSTALISSIIVLFLINPRYESSAKILSSSNTQQTSSGLAGIAAGFGISLPVDGGQSIFSSELFSSIILSNQFLEKILNYSFVDYRDNSKKLLKDIIVKNPDKLSDFEKTKLGIENLQKNIIKVIKDPKTGIVNIIVTTEDRYFSKEVCTSVVNELNQFQQDFNIERAKKKKVFIEQRIADVEKDLSNIENELNVFYQSNIDYLSSPNLVIELNRIKTRYDVSKGVFITLNQEYETAKIEEVKESNFLKIIDKPSLALKKSYPKRKQFVLYWTMLSIIFSSIFFVLRQSKDLIKEKDLEDINELKNIISKELNLK